MDYLEKNPEVNRFDLAGIFHQLHTPDVHQYLRTVIGCGQGITLFARGPLDNPRLPEASAWSFVIIDKI